MSQVRDSGASGVCTSVCTLELCTTCFFHNPYSRNCQYGSGIPFSRFIVRFPLNTLVIFMTAFYLGFLLLV
jgi:hypothetical protein